MIFTDASFGVFIVVLFGLYWSLRQYLTVQNLLVLTASYLFYAWWDWRFLILLILTSFTTWLTALPCGAASAHPVTITAGDSAIVAVRRPDMRVKRWAKALMISNIVLNIGILVIFKYFNFFGENLIRIFNLFGLGLDWFTLRVLLPVGISFYTFQAISYSVDCYRGVIRPEKNPLTFFTYIAFFPQLVAGPIERASQLIPQLARRRVFSRPMAVDGMRMILYGLFKKICVADMIAPIVDGFYVDNVFTPLVVFKITVLFSIQMYCDFSAYSEIARGVAAIFGVRLMANFRVPYFSRNIIEFWGRWHISLMLWFRDYIYIPLGGSRCPVGRQIFNILAVFFLSGLWHGAGRNFVVWGLLWGVIYVAGRFLLGLQRVKESIESKDLWRIILTYGVVASCLYIFRSSHWGEMFALIKGGWFVGCFFLLAALAGWLATGVRSAVWRSVGRLIFAAGGILWVMGQVYAVRDNLWEIFGWVWVPCAVWVLIIEWRNRAEEHPMARVPATAWKRYGMYLLFFLLIVLTNNTNEGFIYFRF